MCLLCHCVSVNKDKDCIELQNTKKLYNHNPDIIEYYFSIFRIQWIKAAETGIEELKENAEQMKNFLSDVDKESEYLPILISYIFVMK